MARRSTRFDQEQPFEPLWRGTAPMEAWTQAVADGGITSIQVKTL
jgi:hypothetical protein